MKHILLLICLLSTVYTDICNAVYVRNNGLNNEYTSKDKIDRLPGYINISAQEVSLFADFNNAGSGKIDLYVINDTNKSQSFSCAWRDLTIKLEFQTKDGSWVRAQEHLYHFCGNAYSRYILPPQHYFKIDGYFPSSGQKKTIRYRRYQHNGVVSHTGIGYVKSKDIKNSFLDRMALYHSTHHYPIRVLLGEIPFLRNSKARIAAINILSQRRFKRENVIPVLERVINDIDAEVRKHAQKEIVKAKIYFGSFEFVTKVATGEITFPNIYNHKKWVDVKKIALSTLVEKEVFYNEDILPTLRKLFNSKDQRIIDMLNEMLEDILNNYDNEDLDLFCEELEEKGIYR
ncbi:hypothetical protein [Candidatus Uabimicrobium sp. HlEnr_7]|uniref:hypothetical protein n=1 Tax=Candidatus Uabimicrobium helgolandensis TaxID=3095367 RepID=UPI003557C033